LPPSFTPAAYIPVLNAVINIPGGNATTAVQPETLQMTQANLACSLGVPQQSIQIRNVTLKYVNGTRVPLPFDPAVAQLNSGTDVVCMTTGATGMLRGANTTFAALRMLQARITQQKQQYTIEISYDIVDPPLVILAMDPVTFTSTITNNTIMIDLVSALGGTSVAAEAPQELASGLAAPSSSPAPTIAELDAQMMMYGGIGAAIGVLAIIIAFTSFFIGRSYRRPLPTTAVEPKRVVYVVENPLSKSPDVNVEYKNNYTPTIIRR